MCACFLLKYYSSGGVSTQRASMLGRIIFDSRLFLIHVRVTFSSQHVSCYGMGGGRGMLFNSNHSEHTK